MQDHSEKINYQIKNKLYPAYKDLRIAPLSGAATSVTDGLTTVYDIPVAHFNLAESRIDFTASPTTSGADKYNLHFADNLAYFKSVELVSLSGVRLAYVDDCAAFTKCVWKPQTPLDQMITYGSNSTTNDIYEGLHSYVGIGGNARADGVALDKPYIENAYFIPLLAAATVNVSVNLSRLFNSFFALDKTVFLGETVQLRFTSNAALDVIPCFGTSATNYSAANTTAFAGTIAISAPYLYLAVEQNQNIINDLNSKFNSEQGISYLTDYVHSIKLPVVASSNSLQIKLNRTHGQTLKRVYTCLRDTVSKDARWDFRKPGLTSLSSSLQDMRLQDYEMSGVTKQDYKQLKRLLKNSCIMSENIHAYNWFYVDSFTDPIPLCESDNGNNEIEGINLEVEQKYSINFTSDDARTAYIFPITQKLVKASKSGLQIM
jgi:hypothetical protein